MAYTSTIEVSNVNRAGEDLIDNTSKMYTSLENIATLIEGSSAFFESNAGAELRSKFNKSAAEFQNFRTFLNQYGEFLKTHATNVNAFESAVEEGLSQIPQL